jgi:outer membrane lipopolysaccharide assembly protein LptE/RlpB
MAKLSGKNLAVVSLFVFLLSGCGFHHLDMSDTSLCILPVHNVTLQPAMEIYLTQAVKEAYLEYPSFSLVDSDEEADYILKIKLKKFGRIPLFYSDNDRIVSARFITEVEVGILSRDKIIAEETLSQNFAFSLKQDYREEEILRKVSRELARKIYFWTINEKEKGII